MRNFSSYPKLVKLLKGFISLSFLAILIWILEWEEVIIALSEFTTLSILFAILVLLIEFPVLGYRWHLLIREHCSFNLYRQLRLYFVANFFNTFTPAQIGGDTVRFFGLLRNEVPAITLIGRLLHERMIGLMGFFIFFLGCFLYALAADLIAILSPSSPLFLVVIAILIALLGALVAAFWGPALINLVRSFKRLGTQKWLIKVLETLDAMLRFGSANNVILVFFLSIVGGSVIWSLAVTIIARDAGVEASFALLGMAATLSDLVRIIPITIQGLGLREATFSYSFYLLGLDPKQGFVIGLVSYLAGSAAIILIGVIGYLMPDPASN